MTQEGKYFTLPDLDSAPDVYETQVHVEIDGDSKPDDPYSPIDTDNDDQEDLLASKVDRHRLQPWIARTQFFGAKIDARGVDFSDRIDGARRSYRASSSNRRRKLKHVTKIGGELYDDVSDGDQDYDAEHLDQRIARLQREIEEVRSAVKHGENGESIDYKSATAEMARVLREVQTTRGNTMKMAQQHQENGNGDITTKLDNPQSHQRGSADAAPDADTTRILTKAADFDARLAVLERILGASTAQLRQRDSAPIKGILSSIDMLERQLAALASVSPTSLENMASQIHQLMQDAEMLADARNTAQEALKGTATLAGRATTHGTAINSPQDGPVDHDQATKIDALYAALPTVETMAPLLPPILERLRSLQLVHADAAAVSGDLSALEKRQALMADEIAEWSTGLQKVEQAMESGKATVGRNAEIVEKWVKDLEARVRKMEV